MEETKNIIDQQKETNQTNQTEEKKYTNKFLFPSIKNKTLQKLVILYVSFFYNPMSETAKPVIKRLNEEHLGFRKANIAFLLKPSDVAPILKCSKRKAQEYIDLLRLLM